MKEFKCLDCMGEGVVPDPSSSTGATECDTCNGTGKTDEDLRSEKQKERDRQRGKS